MYRFLRYFSFLDVAEIDAVERADGERMGRPEAQGILAREVTRLVHGDQGLGAAQRITEALFSGNTDALSEGDLEQLRLDGLPCTQLASTSLPGGTVSQLLTEAGIVSSGKQVKDALGRGAVSVNGRSLSAEDNVDPASAFAQERAAYGRFFLVRLGKKKYHLFELARA